MAMMAVGGFGALHAFEAAPTCTHHRNAYIVQGLRLSALQFNGSSAGAPAALHTPFARDPGAMRTCSEQAAAVGAASARAAARQQLLRPWLVELGRACTALAVQPLTAAVPTMLQPLVAARQQCSWRQPARQACRRGHKSEQPNKQTEPLWVNQQHHPFQRPTSRVRGARVARAVSSIKCTSGGQRSRHCTHCTWLSQTGTGLQTQHTHGSKAHHA